MKSGDEIDGLAQRLEGVQQELLGLFTYLKTAREELGGSRDHLSGTSEALTSIGEVTEKAAHNLLGLVERVMDTDATTTEHLQVLEGGADEAAVREALKGISDAQEARGALMTEMMTELSFQDLTCQTLEKVMRGLTILEKRIRVILEPGSIQDDEIAPEGSHKGSMSGLARLQETQGGGSLQDSIDGLFDRR